MEYNFCTICSQSRLYQCIALYNSLAAKLESLNFFVLCMDDMTYSILNALNKQALIPVALGSLESPELLKLKEQRSISEYCWTMKPVFIEALLNSSRELCRITYLDSDMLFFNSPKPVFISGMGKTVWLTPHNYNESIKGIEKVVGKYNSGFVSFKNNKHALDCLSWWKQSCLEWCFNTTVGGKFGDQKYLDDFDNKFYGVFDISIPGVNVAPWNDEGFEFTSSNGKLKVNGHKLIFYHFCGFKALNKNEFIVQFGNCCNAMIHIPYMKAVIAAAEQVEYINKEFNGYCNDIPDLERFNIFRV